MEQPVFLTRVRRYRIVAGIDLSEYADIVIEHALDQAARHQAPELHFVTVRERRSPSSDEVQQALWERVYPTLEAFNAHTTEWRARLHVRAGKPEEQVPMLAAEIRADLLVVGHFGLHRGASGRIVRAAPCATLVVGLPAAATQQCGACSAVREQTEGDRWFCDQHRASRAPEHAMTPMTTWSHGKYSLTRAA